MLLTELKSNVSKFNKWPTFWVEVRSLKVERAREACQRLGLRATSVALFLPLPEMTHINFDSKIDCGHLRVALTGIVIVKKIPRRFPAQLR
jgi:hypothetical protein